MLSAAAVHSIGSRAGIGQDVIDHHIAGQLMPGTGRGSEANSIEMTSRAPLRVVLFRDPNDTTVAKYENAVVRAFQGGKEPGAYVASGADLGVQLQLFFNTPPEEAVPYMDAFCHTLVLVVLSANLPPCARGPANWLAVCHAHESVSDGRHKLLVLAMEKRFGDGFQRLPGLRSCQIDPVERYGEDAIRPGMVALRALHEARLLLAGTGTGKAGATHSGFLRLFISHAKMDGLPLAQALKHQIQSTRWLQTFYDAEDLTKNPGWRRELKFGVKNSLIIILRTEVYDDRYWCQQEVRWADEYAVPAVLVEARTGLDHPASTLPLDRIPTVRIPDGNLMRILYLALREGLKYLLFNRRVAELRRSRLVPANAVIRTFSFHPSMAALLRICRTLPAKPKRRRYILYPDPVLGTGAYEAAMALVDREAPETILATPSTLAALSKRPGK